MDKIKTHHLKEILPPGFIPSTDKSGFSRLFGREPGQFLIHVYERCTSSLDKAWELISENKINPGDSVICLAQSRGRGRMGREWVSTKGSILAAWMIPRPETATCDNLLPLIVGLTIKRAMLSLGVSLSIKWPNDLIYEHKKVGGILIEEKDGKLVAGIGLNLVSCPERHMMRENSPVQPGSLGDHFGKVGPEVLWAKLVCLAHLWYEEILCNFSLIDFIREINSNLWLMGENILAESGDRIIRGVLTGISEKGEIIVEHSLGTANLISANIRKATRA